MSKGQITYRKDKKDIIIKCLTLLEENSSLSSEGKPKITLGIYYNFIKKYFLKTLYFLMNYLKEQKEKFYIYQFSDG